MGSHMQRFGKAYLVGGLFVLVTVANAIYGEFSGVKQEDMQAWSKFTWFLHWDSVVVAAGTVVLAFLNKSGQGNPPTQELPPAPPPATPPSA